MDLIMRLRNPEHVPVEQNGDAIKHPKWWAFQLRDHNMAETNYSHIAYVSDDMARCIVEASNGSVDWFVFGDEEDKKTRGPNWDTIIAKRHRLTRKRVYETLKKEFEPEKSNDR